jgi:ribosome-binding protein aMBF1 (putative translation factor)
MRLSDLPSEEEVLAEELRHPDFRAGWDRSRFAREVANRVIAYRVDHGLSQTALAKLLGVSQPQVARLEAADVTPSIDTLSRLSARLGLEFHIDITPTTVALSA